ncbi:MAG: CHASE2 domain-containing protein, partial [Armatimonadetes bacterium]|nr:CHASE2 domain-containing protein [Armatimonadota bacterium]
MREGQPAFLRASRTPAGPLPGVGGPLWRRRALWAGLCAALLAALLGPPVLEPWELASQDARLRASPVPRTPPKLAVIGITPESYERFGAIPELFWGNLRAEAIRRAVGLGARVVGLDLIQIRSADAFLEQLEPRRVPPILGPDGRPDAALAEAIQAARQQGRAVVLGWALGPALRPIPLLTAAGGDLGFVDRGPAPEGEPGGVARHVLLWQPEDGRGLPGFAAALALRQRGEDPADPRALARLEQPFGGGPWPHSMRIHYAGPS